MNTRGGEGQGTNLAKRILDIIVLTIQENNPYSNCWEEREMDGSRSLHIFTQQGYVLLIDMFTGKKVVLFFQYMWLN